MNYREMILEARRQIQKTSFVISLYAPGAFMGIGFFLGAGVMLILLHPSGWFLGMLSNLLGALLVAHSIHREIHTVNREKVAILIANRVTEKSAKILVRGNPDMRNWGTTPENRKRLSMSKLSQRIHYDSVHNSQLGMTYPPGIPPDGFTYYRHRDSSGKLEWRLRRKPKR